MLDSDFESDFEKQLLHISFNELFLRLEPSVFENNSPDILQEFISLTNDIFEDIRFSHSKEDILTCQNNFKYLRALVLECAAHIKQGLDIKSPQISATIIDSKDVSRHYFSPNATQCISKLNLKALEIPEEWAPVYNLVKITVDNDNFFAFAEIQNNEGTIKLQTAYKDESRLHLIKNGASVKIQIITNLLSFKRCFDACQTLASVKIFSYFHSTEKRNNAIIDYENIEFNKQEAAASELNEQQQKAIMGFNNAPENKKIALIQGPPGTGKTLTIMHFLQSQIQAAHKKTYVSAPTNQALREIIIKLLKNNSNAPILIFSSKDLPDNLKSFSLQVILSKIYFYKNKLEKLLKSQNENELTKSKNELQEFTKFVLTLQTRYGIDCQKLLNNLSKANKLYDDLPKNNLSLIEMINTIFKDDIFDENQVRTNLFEKSKIIFSTLIGSGENSLRKVISENQIQFDAVVVDEAAQTTFPELAVLLSALYLESLPKLFLIGDQKQLSPLVLSKTEESNILKKSPLEFLIEHAPNAFLMLQTQYRMHSSIGEFVSKLFYNDQLFSGIQSDKNPIEMEENIFKKDALLFFDIQTKSESLKNNQTSLINKGHAYAVMDILRYHLRNSEDKTIGVITPYKGQVTLIKTYLNQEFKDVKMVSVNTIDSFQGAEKDIIIFCAVSATPFVADEKRLTVALSRAKQSLIVIGDRNSFETQPQLQRINAFFENHGFYNNSDLEKNTPEYIAPPKKPSNNNRYFKPQPQKNRQQALPKTTSPQPFNNSNSD